MRTSALLLFALAFFLGQPPVGAQAPPPMPALVNAKVENQAAAGALADQIQAAQRSHGGPLWLGYSLPQVAAQRLRGCGSGDYALGDNLARLEPSPVRSVPARLEGGESIAILYRLEASKVDRVAVYSGDCTLDAGGLPVVWVSGVSAAQSIGELTSLLHLWNSASGKLQPDANAALSAIALTDDPAADRALAQFTESTELESVRERAVYWLGAARGAAGYARLQQLSRSEPNDAVRRQIAFAYSVSPEPGAVDALIQMAKNDASPQVRGQALFWLEQKASLKAVGTLTAAVANDPSAQVKEQAVGAISRLPQEQAVPLLIQLAQSNSDPAVRKRAMTFLGQSHDPRALAFFAKVLKPN